MIYFFSCLWNVKRLSLPWLIYVLQIAWYFSYKLLMLYFAHILFFVFLYDIIDIQNDVLSRSDFRKIKCSWTKNECHFSLKNFSLKVLTKYISIKFLGQFKCRRKKNSFDQNKWSRTQINHLFLMFTKKAHQSSL